MAAASSARSRSDPASTTMASADGGSGSATTRTRPASGRSSAAAPSATRIASATRIDASLRKGARARKAGLTPTPRRGSPRRMRTVQSVTGPVEPDRLGTTLMHEHLLIGYPGWHVDAGADRAARREHVARCVARMEELKAHGLRTL